MKNRKYLLITILLVFMSLLCLVPLWLSSHETVLDRHGIKYDIVKRVDYIRAQISDWPAQEMNVDPVSYESASIVKIDFIAENDISDQQIGKEGKNKFPVCNFMSQEDILNHLDSLSLINRPVSLSFFACKINSNVIARLNLVPEIQSLTFLYCSFDQCSLRDINTSRHFFSLTLSKCSSGQNWKEILFGINNFHKLNFWHSCIQENDLSFIFSAQLHVDELELQFVDIPENSINNVVFSPQLKLINIKNSRVFNEDILNIVKSLDSKSILQLCGNEIINTGPDCASTTVVREAKNEEPKAETGEKQGDISVKNQDEKENQSK